MFIISFKDKNGKTVTTESKTCSVIYRCDVCGYESQVVDSELNCTACEESREKELSVLVRYAMQLSRAGDGVCASAEKHNMTVIDYLLFRAQAHEG